MASGNGLEVDIRSAMAGDEFALMTPDEIELSALDARIDAILGPPEDDFEVEFAPDDEEDS